MMREFFDVIKDDGKSWLICGKGPGLKKLNTLNLKHFRIMTINQSLVVTGQAEIAHFIDLDVLDYEPMKKALSKAKYICCPIFPHEDMRPSEDTLMRHVDRRPELRKAMDEERLLFYNLSTKPVKEIFEYRPLIIKAVHCTAEASFHLLAEAGVKTIYTVGIDGGIGHTDLLSDIPNKNPNSYNLQFQRLNEVVQHYRISWFKL